MKKKLCLLLASLAMGTMFLGCGKVKTDEEQKNYDGRAFYEIFVRSYNDSDGDGIGDLKGVTQKLDYLQDLGVKGIWLMPINESPSYHGYDVIDYYKIQPDYGDFDDLQELLEEAHKRDIKVIMDLVINHTSSSNEWFKSARESKDSEYRDYYIWTDDMSKKNSVSPMQTMEWSKNGTKDELYYSIFWSEMPDLNMDNPKVVEEVKKIAKFYLDKGIDGFRMDAAKWIFSEKEKNVEFWKDFNDYVKSVNKDAILVGEVWDSPYNNVEYTTSLDSFFEFSIGDYIKDEIFRHGIADFPDDYNSVKELYDEENPNFVMASFLRNHDQDRIFSSLGDDLFKMKTAACMYLTLPGTPYIYYGEEIGMIGGGKDENKRQPFIWDTDTSKNTSWEMSTNDENAIAVSVEEKDKDSLLNFYKDILRVRNNYSVLRYGKVEKSETSDENLMGMKRVYQNEEAYVIINASDKSGTVKVSEGSYQVVYSNKGKEEDIKADSEITVDSEEILIVIKK